jgi:hypothetical protein
VKKYKGLIEPSKSLHDWLGVAGSGKILLKIIALILSVSEPMM